MRTIKKQGLRGAGALAALLLVVPWNSLAAQESPADWPRAIEVPEGRVVIYQPQPESFDGHLIAARFALSVTLAGSQEPVFGVAWVEARVETDRDTRIVNVVEFSVNRVRFPNSTEDQENRLAQLLEAQIPRWELEFSLDRLLASLDELEESRSASEGLNNAPPTVLFSSDPTVLVMIDGEPILQAVEGASLMRVVNTPFTMLLASGTYYLYAGEDNWYVSGAIDGDWRVTENVPSAVSALAPPPPEDSVEDSVAVTGAPPRIVVATEPTELIVSEGAPEYTPLSGTDLLYVSNSESDVLLDIQSQRYYIVLSGRWYSAESLDGAWAHVAPDALPETMAAIPPDSEMGHLLLSVPGTLEAQEALLDHQIPQTSAIRRDEATLEVEYDGAPQFERIEDTQMAYAINTNASVIRVDGRYYACSEGVWFVSDDAEGPWRVADSVPDDIYDMPADVPVYNVKYVYVFDSTPDVVYVGYYPGYSYSFVYGGTIVYGTGYYYQPWYGSVYYPYHSTWGFHVRYNPWYGWSYGFSYSTGPFTFAIGWGGYHPHYGGWWGPVGFRGYHAGYHRGWHDGYRAGVGAGYRAGFRAGTRYDNTRANIYQRDRNAGRNVDLPARAGVGPRIQPGLSNDVFSDRNGDVFKRGQDGWQTRQGRDWQPSAPGAGATSRIPDRAQLDRSLQSRNRGTARTRTAPPRPRARGGRRG